MYVSQLHIEHFRSNAVHLIALTSKIRIRNDCPLKGLTAHTTTKKGQK